MVEIETSFNLQIQNALGQEREQLPSRRNVFLLLYLITNIYTEIFQFTNINTDLLMHFAIGLFQEAFFWHSTIKDITTFSFSRKREWK